MTMKLAIFFVVFYPFLTCSLTHLIISSIYLSPPFLSGLLQVCVCPSRTGVQEIVRHKGSITSDATDNPLPLRLNHACVCNNAMHICTNVLFFIVGAQRPCCWFLTKNLVFPRNLLALVTFLCNFCGINHPICHRHRLPSSLEPSFRTYLSFLWFMLALYVLTSKLSAETSLLFHTMLFLCTVMMRQRCESSYKTDLCVVLCPEMIHTCRFGATCSHLEIQ